MIVDLDRRWVRDARCAGMPSRAFFFDHSVKAMESPTAKIQAQWDKSKQVCEFCPVRTECARDSLGEVEGVWGGLDPAERQRLRVDHSQRVRRMKDKSEYAELAYHLHEQRGNAYPDVARIMGLSIGTCKFLVQLHRDAIAPTQTLAPADVVALDSVKVQVAWPSRAPSDGDGWVRYGNRVVRGYYLGETEDGDWVQLKVPLSKEYSAAWFKKEDVKILRRIQRKVLRRAGRMSRIYGTTISGSPERAKAG